MAKDIAVVVCNYNKKEYVLRCVSSILSQTVIDDIDVFVVDNASTDGSSDALREEFGERIFVIDNPVNNGGSGGFNAGMRHALSRPYRYIVLADNDIRMDEAAIERLHSYMEMHGDVGIAGAAMLLSLIHI